MIRCFLIPMTEPPYSRENNQRPKYINELKINWSGLPLFNAKMYVVEANSEQSKLEELQSKQGVIDFPNTDSDEVDTLPAERKQKDKEIKNILKLKDVSGEKVKDYINRCANSEFKHGWDKDLVFAG